jgi:transcriptional regulator GlxA family with amidase domain
VFRQHTGYSPQELLNRVRIRAAHRLIAEGQLKKSAVARHVGYATFSALYRRLRDPNSPVR